MYFLYTTSFATLEQAQNYKCLDSYKYFIAGWVIEHKWKLINDCCLITGKVNHSYAVINHSTTAMGNCSEFWSCGLRSLYMHGWAK